jgi:hypothetical protein
MAKDSVGSPNIWIDIENAALCSVEERREFQHVLILKMTKMKMFIILLFMYGNIDKKFIKD